MTAVYGDVAADCLRRLRDRGETLSAAESLTAGLLTSALASLPGSSSVLRGGMTAYATDVKVSVLGVDQDLVDRHGVVSAECVEQMAVRCRHVFGSSWALSTTGVAGPDSQEGHRVGTVFVAVAEAGGATVRRLELEGSRQQIREAAASAAMALLQEELAGRAPDEEPEGSLERNGLPPSTRSERRRS